MPKKWRNPRKPWVRIRFMLSLYVGVVCSCNDRICWAWGTKQQPDFDGSGETQQIVNVPVRLGNGLKMVANASADAAMAASASDVGVKSRDDGEFSQPANSQPLRLCNRSDQDVSAFAFR